jgi:PhnB protein
MSQFDPASIEFSGLAVQLTVASVDAAVAFYRTAFGASELYRNRDPESGRVVFCELLIGAARVTLHEEFLEYGLPTPQTLGGTPVSLNLHLPDVDMAYDRALAAGGEAIAPPANRFWGARTGAVLDPFGHRWVLTTMRVDLSPQQIVEASRGVGAQMRLSAARPPKQN